MKTTRAVLSSLEALLQVIVNQADRHGLDEVRISKPRARELLSDVRLAIEETKRPEKPSSGCEKRLDAIFGI